MCFCVIPDETQFSDFLMFEEEYKTMKQHNKHVYLCRVTTRILALLICVSLTTISALPQKISVVGKLDSGKTIAVPVAVAPTPILFGENPSCAKLNTNNPGYPELAHIISDYELKLNFTPPIGVSGPYQFVTNSPTQILNGIPDANNSVTIEGLQQNQINFTSTKGISAVIIEGETKSYVYPYPTPTFSGMNLQSPDNGLQPIRFVSFCYYTPATVTIIKQVQTYDGGNASPQAFAFTATNFGTSNFSLVDNNAQPADRITNNAVYSFGAANPINVIESTLASWSLSDLDCVETAGGGGLGFPNLPNLQNTTTSLADRKATIVAEQGENITCTYSNLQSRPTAGSAYISGRVLTETGLPVKRAAVTVFNANTLESQTVYSNAFGFYRVDNLPVSNFYIVTVAHGKRSFLNNPVSFTLSDNLSEINFTASY